MEEHNMEFTGSLLTLKRNIYPQTGNYNFSMSCTVDNTSGTYFFGLSGNGNNIEFKLESGKIYFDNKFIHSYQAYQDFSIASDITNSKINISKNDIPIIFGFDKPTGYYEYFYFKRSKPGLSATFDLRISGDNIPRYSIQNNGYLVSTGQNAVTGYFSNLSNFPIKVFDSSIDTQELFSFGKLAGSIANLSSGSFAYTGDYQSLDISQPISTTFNTNFGDILMLFTITDLTAVDGFVLLQDITDFTLDSNDALNRDITYTNYSGGFVTTGFNTQLSFVLDYISGSGVFVGYDKSFTGAWNMMTGVNSSSLYSMPVSINSLGTRMAGSGVFNPSSFINFQLNHITSGTNSDSATLTISGLLVSNPISTILDIPNT